MSKPSPVKSKPNSANIWELNAYGQFVEVDQRRRFSKHQSQQIREAVEEVCALRQTEPFKLCSECQHKPEYRGIWVEIAKKFPEFRVQAVYRHAIRLFHPFKRGPWNDEELDKLIQLVGQHGRSWRIIQHILDRCQEACRDKYRECRVGLVKGKWSTQEAEELEHLVRDFLKVPETMTLKEIGKMITEEDITIPWSTFSKKFGNRSRLSCFKKFEKMAGLYIEYRRADAQDIRAERLASRKKKGGAKEFDITGDPDMYLLAELVKSGAHRASEIPWETLRVEDAQEKWNSLVLEWQQHEGEEATEEPMTTLPLCDLAQLLLDRKNNAKIAEQTVEAIDLPVI